MQAKLRRDILNYLFENPAVKIPVRCSDSKFLIFKATAKEVRPLVEQGMVDVDFNQRRTKLRSLLLLVPVMAARRAIRAGLAVPLSKNYISRRRAKGLRWVQRADQAVCAAQHGSVTQFQVNAHVNGPKLPPAEPTTTTGRPVISEIGANRKAPLEV